MCPADNEAMQDSGQLFSRDHPDIPAITGFPLCVYVYLLYLWCIIYAWVYMNVLYVHTSINVYISVYTCVVFATFKCVLLYFYTRT